MFTCAMPLALAARIWLSTANSSCGLLHPDSRGMFRPSFVGVGAAAISRVCAFNFSGCVGETFEAPSTWSGVGAPKALQASFAKATIPCAHYSRGARCSNFLLQPSPRVV